MNKRDIRTVILDLDGTLLDTMQDIAYGINLMFARHNLPVLDISAFYPIIGFGIRKLIETAAPDDAQSAVVEAVLQEYQKYYPEHCTERTVCFDGIEALLQGLCEKGYELGVFTNKTESSAQKIISYYFPNIPFRFVWGDDGKRPLKPKLEAGHEICRILGRTPQQIMYIGDGDTDMKFASGMGFYAVGVSWGYRKVEDLIACGADTIVHTPQEILQLLEQG